MLSGENNALSVCYLALSLYYMQIDDVEVIKFLFIDYDYDEGMNINVIVLSIETKIQLKEKG